MTLDVESFTGDTLVLVIAHRTVTITCNDEYLNSGAEVVRIFIHEEDDGTGNLILTTCIDADGRVSHWEG